MATDAEVVKQGWETVAQGDWDTLISDYTDDMIFVMPGQNDVLEGKAAFRSALDNIGAALPPGFDITAIQQIGETVSTDRMTSEFPEWSEHLRRLATIDELLATDPVDATLHADSSPDEIEHQRRAVHDVESRRLGRSRCWPTSGSFR